MGTAVFAKAGMSRRHLCDLLKALALLVKI
jgi:hypothetical protein